MADHNRVRPLLFPRSVAVVGASPRHGRIIEEVVRHDLGVLRETVRTMLRGEGLEN